MDYSDLSKINERAIDGRSDVVLNIDARQQLRESLAFGRVPGSTLP